MNERFLKKLSRLLAKSGLEEDKISQIMNAVTTEDESEEEAPVEEVSESAPAEEPAPVEDAAPESEPEVPEETPVEQPAPEETPAMEEPGMQEQPEMPVAAPQPAVDYQPQIDEMKAALDGMSARIDSLLENLSKSGVLSVVEENAPIGVETNSTPANQTSGEDAMTSVLAKLNRGSF